MKSFKRFLIEMDTNADYCTGLSINADLWWNKDKDVSFLTMAGKDTMAKILADATAKGRMKVFDKRLTSYGSDPKFGFTYLIVLGQSHIMLHTWPEKHLMNLDIFTCGSEGDPKIILSHIRQELKPDYVQTNQNQRGVRKDIHSANEKPDRPQDIKPPQQTNMMGH